MDGAVGRRLRTLRRKRGLSQAIVAHRVGHSERWLRNVETGSVDLWVSDALRLAEVLGVEIGDILHARVAPPTWWRGELDRRPGVVALHDVARLMRMVDSPRAPDPERLDAVLNGSSTVDRQLVETLAFVARQLPRQWGELPYASLWQLVHTQLLAFQVLLSEPVTRGLRRELESAAAATAAFAGQISIFGGRSEHAVPYLRLASGLASRAGDAETHALALMFTSHLYSDAFLGGLSDGMQREARGLLQAAERLVGASTSAVAHAWVLLCTAEQCAGSDELEAWRLVDEAERLFGGARVPADGICCHWGPHVLATYRGHVALVSDHPGQAIPLLEGALASLRPGALVARSAARADLGRAYVRLGEVDHACDLLGQAFALAQQADLTGPVAGIIRVRRHDLAAHAMEPAVRRLDERLRAIA